MRLSELRIPFLVERQEPLLGGTASTWTTVTAVWGRLTRLGEGNHYDSSDKATHEILIRACPDCIIEIGMCFAYEARRFLVLFVDQDNETRRWWRFRVQEIKYLD